MVWIVCECWWETPGVPTPTPASPFISLFPLTLLKRGSRKNFRSGPQLIRGEAVQLVETASLTLAGSYTTSVPLHASSQLDRVAS